MASPEQLGYARVPIVSSARSLFGRVEPGRGNLVLVVESTGELAALRQAKPPGFILPKESAAVLGPGRGLGLGGEIQEGRIRASATLPEEQAENLRQQRMRLARGLPVSEAGVLEMPLNVPARPVQVVRAQREEYAALIVPAEVLEALRGYYARRGATRITQAEAVNAAAYALYTAKLRSLPMGYRVTAQQEVGSPRWVLDQLAAAEVPGRGVVGQALVPGRFPSTWTPSNIPGEIPVTYETVAAVLFFTHGPLYLRRENFANIIKDQLGWRPCGTSGVFDLSYLGMRLPATNTTIWCPPPRSFPIAPPRAPQQRLEGFSPPPFPQHARPRRKEEEPPGKYRPTF